MQALAYRSRCSPTLLLLLRRNLLLPTIHRCDLLDGLMASLAFKPVQARRLSDALKKKHSESLKGPAAAAQVEAPPVRIMLRP